MVTGGGEPGLELSERYRNPDLARQYAERHRTRKKRWFSSRRELKLCEQALRRIGRVDRLLDVPAGTGRFWKTLRTHCVELHVADAAPEMLDEARARHPEVDLAGVHVSRVEDLALPRGTFDVVFCSRLLHHFAGSAERVAILERLAEVSSRYVIFTAWVTGNLAHRLRLRKERRDPARKRDRTCVPLRALKSEARRAGLDVLRVRHKVRGISPVVLVVARKAGVSGPLLARL